MKFLLKCLLWKRKLKVLKDQDSVKNTTDQILYEEDLKKTKMVREHISLINDIKYDKKEEKKEHTKNHQKTKVILMILFSIFVGINARKKVFLEKHKNMKHVINTKALRWNKLSM